MRKKKETCVIKQNSRGKQGKKRKKEKKRMITPYLEDVLLAVNNRKPSNLIDSSNISRVQPSLIINCIPSILLILIVTIDDMSSTETDLASGVGQVSRAVVHVGNVYQFHLAS